MKDVLIKIQNEERMIHLGETLANYYYPNLVISLTGDLGAGKTTFTKGIGRALGIKRVINSPTFTIMKVYNETNNLNGIKALYHLDIYRLKDSSGDFELEEYFYMNGLSVVEWADNAADLIPSNSWRMEISNTSDTERLVHLILNDDTNLEKLKKTLIGEKYEIIN